jgi:nucleoside-diphosphate-sugar epimerase
MEAIVFGAGGQMGRAVALALADAGWSVRGVTRGDRTLDRALRHAGVTRLADTGLTRAELIGAGADLVFDPLCMNAAQAEALLAARRDVGRFVVVSTAAVYADAQGRCLEQADDLGFPQFAAPVTEDQTTLLPGEGYGPAKVAMERALLASGATVAILRPGAIHGPLARHPREWVIVKRILDGRPAMPVIHDGHSRFHTTSAQAVGMLVGAIAAHRADGIYNVADPDAPSVREIAAALATEMGEEIDLIGILPQEDDLAHIGHTPWSVPAPYLLDCRRAAVLDWTPPSYADAIAPYVEWLVSRARAEDWHTAFPGFAHYGFDPFDYAAEDRVLAQYV